MKQSKQLANRFKEVLLNGTWIANTNFKEQLADVNWQEATTKIGSLNTIALLTFHINYYISGLNDFLEKGSLEIRDKYSFDMLTITTKEDWQQLKDTLIKNSEKFAISVEQIPNKKLNEIFVNPNYGTYQRNINGMIEHTYYHLGQISLIKKLIREQ